MPHEVRPRVAAQHASGARVGNLAPVRIEPLRLSSRCRGLRMHRERLPLDISNRGASVYRLTQKTADESIQDPNREMR